MEIILVGIGLAMDAFSASLVKGLCLVKDKLKYAIIIGLFFGTAQAVMFIIGTFLGNIISTVVNTYGCVIAFVILLLIGINMIREGFKEEEYWQESGLDYREIFLLAIATSIDSLAIGVSYSLVSSAKAFFSAMIIGIITFLLSMLGLMIGCKLGADYRKKSVIFGGVILILIGFKTLWGMF